MDQQRHSMRQRNSVARTAAWEMTLCVLLAASTAVIRSAVAGEAPLDSPTHAPVMRRFDGCWLATAPEQKLRFLVITNRTVQIHQKIDGLHGVSTNALRFATNEVDGLCAFYGPLGDDVPPVSSPLLLTHVRLGRTDHGQLLLLANDGSDGKSVAFALSTNAVHLNSQGK